MDESIREVLERISGAITGRRIHNLHAAAAEEFFGRLLDGEGEEVQVAYFLAAMRAKGATSEELVGCAQAVRKRLEFPSLPPDALVLATSRKGKLHQPPMGLAAAAAASAAGVPVLLQSGAAMRGGGVTLADLWRRVIGEPSADAAAAAAALATGGLACWDPGAGHRGWRRLLDVEDRMGMRGLPDVVMKLLVSTGAPVVAAAMPGPVLGIAAESFGSLGHHSVLVVQGVEGSVDPALTETTRGLRLLSGQPSTLRVEPGDYALGGCGEPPQEHEDRLEAAVMATRKALLGAAGPEADAAALGAGLLLSVARNALDVAGSVAEAREALESGAAQARLESLADSEPPAA